MGSDGVTNVSLTNNGNILGGNDNFDGLFAGTGVAIFDADSGNESTEINGITIIDFTDPTPKSFDGFIALQLHSGGEGNMRFKDIYIRDMSVR